MRKRRSKYGAIRVEYDGHKFDSKMEAARYKQLKLMEKAGQLTNLERQEDMHLHLRLSLPIKERQGSGGRCEGCGNGCV